jgi:O-antigen/teichoic acid export membrane protein
MLSSLLIVRYASHDLRTDEFGLWSFVYGSVGYLLMLDLGLSYAIGRLFADHIYKNDHVALSGYVKMCALIFLVQSIIILTLGIILKAPIIHTFQIHDELKKEAGYLWIGCILIQGCTLPLRVFPAILYAQNRAYVANIITSISIIVNLLIFIICLKNGFRTISYVYANAVSSLLLNLGFIMATTCGFHKIRFCNAPMPIKELPSIYKFSMSVFASSFSSQASTAAQVIIITKILGLDAVAIYSVTSRVSGIIAQLALKPIDALRPRWVGLYCENKIDTLRIEFLNFIKISILILGCVIITSISFTPLFVNFWTLPKFFGGYLLTILVSIAIPLSLFGNQLSILFHTFKIMKTFTIITLIGSCMEIILSLILSRKIGLCGIPLSMIAFSGGVVLFFNIIKSANLLQLNIIKNIKNEIKALFLSIAISIILLIIFIELINKNYYKDILVFLTIALSQIPLLLKIKQTIKK